MKNIKKVIAAFLCLSIALLCGCSADTTETTATTQAAQVFDPNYGYQFPATVFEGVSVEGCFLYSGEYVEDNSFERCEKIAAIKVKNSALNDIQLLRIIVKTDVKEMLFEVTSLLAGETVVVLEKSRQTIADNEKILEFSYSNRVYYEKNVSMHEDIFQVQGNLATINIKNISGTDIDTDIYVYYKLKDAEGNYFGGATFRAKAEGGLKADEIKQLPAPIFDPYNSEVLFVDYGD